MTKCRANFATDLKSAVPRVVGMTSFAEQIDQIFNNALCFFFVSTFCFPFLFTALMTVWHFGLFIQEYH